MDQFNVGDFWASPSDVLWRVAATDESKHASYAVLTRVKKEKGRITLPMSATKGWERIATAADARFLGTESAAALLAEAKAVDARLKAFIAVDRLIGELR